MRPKQTQLVGETLNRVWNRSHRTNFAGSESDGLDFRHNHIILYLIFILPRIDGTPPLSRVLLCAGSGT